jgi:hypothetical protein
VNIWYKALILQFKKATKKAFSTGLTSMLSM